MGGPEKILCAMIPFFLQSVEGEVEWSVECPRGSRIFSVWFGRVG